MQDILDSEQIKKQIAEMSEAYIVLSESPEAHRPCYIIDYIILEPQDLMIAIIGSRSGLQFVGNFPFDKEVLTKWLEFYDFNLLPEMNLLYKEIGEDNLILRGPSREKIDPKKLPKYLENYLKMLPEAYIMLHNLFIEPISKYLEFDKQHLIINTANAHYLYPAISSLDFQFLFDVRHRYGMTGPDEDILITKVNPALNIAQTVKNIEKFHKPQPKDMLILFALGEDSIDEKYWNIYQNAFAQAEEKGAMVTQEATVDDFFHAICCDCNQKVVQIIAHNPDYGIQMSDGYISLRDLEERMTCLAERGQLGDDINIDAHCCTVFPDIAETLYQKGAILVFSSPQIIPVLLSACLLLELYSGRNSIYPKPSYLDGSTYIHEAWHKVKKSFYIKSYRGETISLPEQQ